MVVGTLDLNMGSCHQPPARLLELIKHFDETLPGIFACDDCRSEVTQLLVVCNLIFFLRHTHTCVVFCVYCVPCTAVSHVICTAVSCVQLWCGDSKSGAGSCPLSQPTPPSSLLACTPTAYQSWTHQHTNQGNPKYSCSRLR